MKVWNWAAMMILLAPGLSPAAPAPAQTHHHRHHAIVAASHAARRHHDPGPERHAVHAHRREAALAHRHGKRRHGHHLAAHEIAEAATRLRPGHRHAKLCQRVGTGRHAKVTCR